MVKSLTRGSVAALLLLSWIHSAAAAQAVNSHSTDMDDALRVQRHLMGQARTESTFVSAFTDATGTEYNEAAQAWRFLGIYIDCETSQVNENSNGQEEEGDMEEEDEKEEGEGEGEEDDGDVRRQRRNQKQQQSVDRGLEGGDENGEDDQAEDQQEEEQGEDEQDDNDNDEVSFPQFTTTCSRYALWAAYVDVNHDGGDAGLGEYEIFNPITRKWDDTACKMTDSDRCVKMDCHLSNSKNFRLLGYYKQYNVNEFLQQIIQHHGSCSWNSGVQQLMYNTYQSWPAGCSYLGAVDDGMYELYIDIKPEMKGKMEVGLYQDNQCLTPYEGSSVTVQEAMKTYASNNKNNEEEHEGENNNNNQNSYFSNSEMALGSEEYFEAWNGALAAYQTCQPCISSSIYSYLVEEERRLEGEGEGEGDEHEGGSQDNAENENAGPFQCQDSTGKVSVNQCMLFATETEIAPAYFRDVQKATRQGTIAASHHVQGLQTSGFDEWVKDWGFFTLSLLVFSFAMFCMCCLIKIKTRVRQVPPLSKNSNVGASNSFSSRQEPLLKSTDTGKSWSSSGGRSSARRVAFSPEERASQAAAAAAKKETATKDAAGIEDYHTSIADPSTRGSATNGANTNRSPSRNSSPAPYGQYHRPRDPEQDEDHNVSQYHRPRDHEEN
eukprot:CAMPEP_0172467200 /NCGR_PEP_ID=MMETSP1065-20121228/58163_1 /TAXON_ID=265537 /ORGANISM="Amphiprora paludosa, Strain CCMP125" /LENGTH=662 /DNA_ID=CAMNT_0013224277 /DNA_START=149 /DNA_END=2137 /DNA_ORIENTATION=-